MVKLPRIPQEKDDQPDITPQDPSDAGAARSESSGGILDGWKPPEWNLHDSGLGILLDPETIAQIDFGEGLGSYAEQPLAAQVPTNAQAAQAPHWSAKNNSVHLSPDMSAVAESVGRDFNAQTGRSLVVTGGARTPAGQAEAMYDKFIKGDRSTYKGPSGREIQGIYDRGTAAGQTREDILQSMTASIQSQMDAGHPVSNHLDDRALDFRANDLNDRERAALQDAIRRNSGRPLAEGVPQHIHGSFPRRGPR